MRKRPEPFTIIKTIQSKIYEVRSERIMLDRDLAALYETETKVLNLAVKRNHKRFPVDFMFQLTAKEMTNLRFQIETSSLEQIDYHLDRKSKSVKTEPAAWGGNRYMPYAFTEQGIAMLSSVVNSDKAIAMNISIMRAFVEVRKLLLIQNDFREQLKLIKDRLGEHDVQLQHIYDAMENLLDENAQKRKWEDRNRIGFRK